MQVSREVAWPSEEDTGHGIERLQVLILVLVVTPPPPPLFPYSLRVVGPVSYSLLDETKGKEAPCATCLCTLNILQ